MVGPVSDLAAHAKAIRASLTKTPVRTVAEACDRIEALTGVRRRPAQVRQFLAGLGFRWRRVRAIPVPQNKTSRTTSRNRKASLDTRLRPRLDRAVAGTGNVLFVDAAHVVYGT